MLSPIGASGLILAVVVWANLAGAEELSRATVIEWRAPAECPSQVWLEGEVQRLSGTRLDASGSSIAIQARVTRPRDRRWHVALSTTEDGQSGVRELDAATCEELARSTALLIGLLLRPTAETPEPAPEPAPEPVPAAARTVEVAPPSAHSKRAPTFHANGFAGPVLAAQIGILPGLSPSFGVTLGSRLGVSRLGLSALYSPPSRGQAKESPAAQGQFQLLSLGGSLCFELIHEQPAAGLCVSIDWQRLTGEGISRVDSLRPVVRSVNFFTIGGGAFLRLCAAKRLCFPLKLEALAPTRRPAYMFEDELVLRPAAISGRLSLAAEFSLP